MPQKKAKGDKEQVPEEDDPVFEESQESPHDVTMTEEPGDNTQGEHDKTLVQDDDDMDTGDTAPPNADKTLVRLTSTDDPDTDIVHRLHSMVTGRSPGPGTPATSGHNTSMRSGGSDEPVTHGVSMNCWLRQYSVNISSPTIAGIEQLHADNHDAVVRLARNLSINRRLSSRTDRGE